MFNLVIDSGASKSDWIFFDGAKSIAGHGTGINPVSNRNADQLEHPVHEVHTDDVTRIYYYGAGVAGAEAKKNVLDQLIRIYPKAKTIEVHSDLMGAARACSANQISIVSILGTGSNSCLFDGQSIQDYIPSLGYIFGDAGSGCSIGKEVVKSFFLGDMPESDREKFISSYGREVSPILSQIYGSEKPNYELAKYAKFLNTTEPEYRNYILERVFSNFLEEKVKRIKKTPHFPLNFVGSIAFYFQDILKAVCRVNGYEVNNILEKPIDNLKEFHLENG